MSGRENGFIVLQFIQLCVFDEIFEGDYCGCRVNVLKLIFTRAV